MNSYSLIPWSLLRVSRKPPPNLFREEILLFIQRGHQPLILLVSSLLCCPFGEYASNCCPSSPRLHGICQLGCCEEHQETCRSLSFSQQRGSGFPLGPKKCKSCRGLNNRIRGRKSIETLDGRMIGYAPETVGWAIRLVQAVGQNKIQQRMPLGCDRLGQEL